MLKIKNKLFLIDAFALIYRAYFAFAKNPRINSKGLETSAVFGFTNSLLEILRKENPSHIAVVFDTKKPTERHIEFPQYKAHRDAMPEGISRALPYIDKLLEALKIPKLFMDGYEADDVIGTIAKKAEKNGFQVYMMTSDKDFAQLVSENIFMHRPGNKWQPTETWGIKEVLEKFQIKRVEQVIDFLAMMGDAADNIPGISGVGKKTAQKFINDYDSVEGLFANTDKLKGKIREKVESSKEIGLLSKKLVTIITDVPIEIDFEQMELSIKDLDALTNLFEELEFRNFLNRFSQLIHNEEETPMEKKEIIDNEKTDDSQFDLFSNVVPAEKSNNFLKLDSYIKIISSFLDLEQFLEKNSKENSLVFNFILDKDSVHGLGLSFKENEYVFINFSKTNQNYKQLLKQLFENPTVSKISYNIKPQLKILKDFDIALCGDIFDVNIAHYILHPDMRHNLDIISENYLSLIIESDKDLLRKSPNKNTLTYLSEDKLAQVSSKRILTIQSLYPIFLKELENIKSKDLFLNIEMPLVRVLSKMENQGISLDVSMLNEYSFELEKVLVKCTEKIYNLAESKFNISSPKQLGEILFDQMMLVKKPKKTKSGQYSTSEETLLALKDEHVIIEYILEYREIKKLLSTYVKALPLLVNNSGKIHTTFNQSVAATGRLSSTNPNIQNIPIRSSRGMRVRESFIASQNCILLAADYSQIELRIMASLSNDSTMLKAFNEGIDIHTATAAKVFKVEVKDVSRNMRSKAKSVNFGIIYGISAFGLAQNTGMSRKESKEVIEQYFEEFPGIKKYMDHSINIARENEFVETIFGRRRYLKDINSRNAIMRNAAERNAINAPIQGSAADIIKKAMIDIDIEITRKGLKSKMLLQVHDELIFDMLKSEEQELREIVNDCMSNVCKLSVPLVVDIGIGDNWLQAH
jgi:DNA polymerase I